MKKIVIVFLLAPLLSLSQKNTTSGTVKFLALGDSYTIGESVPIKDRWPVQLIDALVRTGMDCNDPKIIAKTGWRTDDLMNAITAAKPATDYNLVSLLIGVNNFYQGKSVESYKPEFEELLKKAILLANGDKRNVFVVSIPDYGYTPFGRSYLPSVSKGIDDFNYANQAIALKLGVTHVTITDISRKGLDDPTLVAGDGLHPSGKMYAAWVERILEQVKVDPSRQKIEPPSPDQGNIPPVPAPDLVTGIERARYGVKVYPNPFGTRLEFEIPESNTGNIQIFDSKGLLVKTIMFNSNAYIDTSLLHSGVYHYQVTSQNGVLCRGKLFKT